MSDYESISLHGSILNCPIRDIAKKDLFDCHALKFVRNVGESHWEEFVFESSIPLRGEDPADSDVFGYKTICRRSGARIAILSHNRRIVDEIESRLSKEVFAIRLSRVSIAVDALVKAMAKRPTVYSLSFVYARVPAFGAALRNISFYGDDLGEASLFRENVNLMNVFVCGIRRASVGGSEILRLTSDGRISFKLPAAERVLEVEEVLRYLRTNNYLDTTIFDNRSDEDKDKCND